MANDESRTRGRAVCAQVGFVTMGLLTSLACPGCEEANEAEPARDAGMRDGAQGMPADAGQESDADAASDAATDDAGSAPRFSTGVPTWLPITEVGFGNDGRSALIKATIPAAQRYVALRVTPDWFGASPEDPSTCYQLEQVSAGDHPWVAQASSMSDYGEICLDCTQRVQVLPGFGAYVFPNDGSALTSGFELAFRVALRDCATLSRGDATFNPDAPTFAAVEYAVEPWAEPDVPAKLPLRVAVADELSTLSAATLEASPLWQAAVATLQQLYATAAITPEIEAVVAVRSELGGAPLRFGPGQMRELDRLSRTARDAMGDGDGAGPFVPVVLLPCMERVLKGQSTPLLGYTPRIPGGLQGAADHAAMADGLFIQAGSCDPGAPLSSPWSSDAAEVAGARLGVLLAHELGHYLGLHHADTSAGAHMQDADEASSDNVMVSLPTAVAVTSAAFTEGQRAVLRTHPHLRLLLP